MNGKKINPTPLPLCPETISYKIVFQPFQRILPINP